MPTCAYALAASRHMHVYGTTREDLAAVAVAAREWALLNPLVWEKEKLSIADVLGARMVSFPLGVRDCCLVTDGGGAIVVTSAARAQNLQRPPVFVLGVGECLSHATISGMPDLTVTGAAQSGAGAYAMARLTPADVRAAQVYDAFTINTILFLEDLGLCPKGEGGQFVASGAIGPGGTLPVNTSGGGLSYCHPGMYGLLVMIEAIRQVRGECGARQVGGCDVALAHGNGGVLLTTAQVMTVAAGILCYPAAMWFVHRTKLGRRMRAVASNPFLAEITRLDPRAMHVIVMAVGSAIVCLPGVLVPLDLGLQPFGGLPMLLTATIAMIAGGVGSITGAFVLAVAIAVLQNLSLLVIPGEWSIGITFFIFVISMLFRPRGLFTA